MAEKEATLIVRLKDAMSTPLGGLMGKLSQLKSGYLAVAGAVAGLTSFMKSALQAYMEQETANNKLNVALQNQGIYTAQTSMELQKYAAALMQTTTFSDEAIVEQMALLTTFGLTGNKMKEATKAALDLAVGLGIDLRSATMLVGKAAAGETGALSRYGIVIADNTPKAEKFAAVLQQVNARFGGAAQSQVDTTAGRITNLGNRWGELKETIGGMLVPALTVVLGQFEKVVTVVDAITSSSAPFVRFAVDVGSGFLELGKSIINGLFKPIEMISPLLEKVGIDLTIYHDSVTALIDQQIAQLQSYGTAAETEATKKVMAEGKKQKAVKDTTKAVTDELAKQRKATEDAILHDIRTSTTQTQTKRQLLNTQAMDFQSSINYISSMQYAKNREMAAVGKSAAIMMATVDTYRAATGAYAALSMIPYVGPVLGAAAAAAAIAAGLANVAKISGVNLAEGGIVMPTPGGTQATIGEAGYPEAVIPLDDDRTAGLMGGAHVTINAGVVVADRMSVREFAKMIDEELYRMTINRRSVAF